MIGVLGWKPSDLESCSLRELVVAYESAIIEKWHHTSHTNSYVYNLMAVVVNAMGGSKVQPKAPSAFHPFLKPKTSGMKIGKENFRDLKFVMSLTKKS